MRNFKRTICLSAVPQLDFIFRFCHVLIVAPLTEIVRSVAKVSCYAATEQAFPLDMIGAMLVAHGVTDAVGFHLAVFAEKVLSRRRFFESKVYCAVNHPSEVRFGAAFTLVKAARVNSERKQVLEEWACR